MRAIRGAAACMPFPLSLACHLDNTVGPHFETMGWRCRIHDAAMSAYDRGYALAEGVAGSVSFGRGGRGVVPDGCYARVGRRVVITQSNGNFHLTKRVSFGPDSLELLVSRRINRALGGQVVAFLSLRP